MKYMLLLYEPEGAYEGEAGQKTLAEIIALHMKLAEDLAAGWGMRLARGVLEAGERQMAEEAEARFRLEIGSRAAELMGGSRAPGAARAAVGPGGRGDDSG